MLTNTCPYCSDTLLRHVRSTGIYWFCCYCHQEVPNLISRQESPYLGTLSLSSRKTLTREVLYSEYLLGNSASSSANENWASQALIEEAQAIPTLTKV